MENYWSLSSKQVLILDFKDLIRVAHYIGVEHLQVPKKNLQFEVNKILSKGNKVNRNKGCDANETNLLSLIDYTRKEEDKEAKKIIRIKKLPIREQKRLAAAERREALHKLKYETKLLSKFFIGCPLNCIKPKYNLAPYLSSKKYTRTIKEINGLKAVVESVGEGNTYTNIIPLSYLKQLFKRKLATKEAPTAPELTSKQAAIVNNDKTDLTIKIRHLFISGLKLQEIALTVNTSYSYVYNVIQRYKKLVS